MAQINPGDRLNDFIRKQSYFSAGLSTPVEKRANSFWYWRNTGLPVNVRKANGRSGANVSNSAKASQAAKRAGPGVGPGAAKAMYAQIKSELDAELGESCPVISNNELDMIETMIKESLVISGSPVEMSGGRRRTRKQRGGAKFYDELKRVLRIICVLPKEVAKEIDDQGAAALTPVGDALIDPSIAPSIAKMIRERIFPGLLAAGLIRDLGTNGSFTIRIINAIVSCIGYFFNPSLTAGWYTAFVGNLKDLAVGSGSTLVGLAAVIAMNYEGVRVFQGIYNKVMASYGASPSNDQIAAGFEGTVIQYVQYLSTRALVNSYQRLPARLQDAVIHRAPQLAEEALDQQLAVYMAGVPSAQAPRRRASQAAMAVLRNGPASRKTRRSRR